MTTTYSWNARNQLTGIIASGVIASFSYDSFGRRTGKTINGITTNFVYDGLNPVQEKNGTLVTANLLTSLGIDEFLTRTDALGTRALLPDALGSTVALGDGTGALQTQYTYEPFGFTTQAGSVSTNSYKYTGSWDPDGHWDVDNGKGSRQRYNQSGEPISADEAHGRRPIRPIPVPPGTLPICPQPFIIPNVPMLEEIMKALRSTAGPTS